MTAASLVLLVAVVAAFVGLDGIGRGTALRAVTGTAGRDRGLVLAGTGPQLLLGHVWMVAAAGLLVGLFPRWEGAVVSSAYWWVLAIAAGLVLRVAALGVAALGIPRPGARTGTGPDAVRTALAATGALATAAGTGGFLAVAAGVWPVLGALAVIGFDVVVSGRVLGVRVPMWTLVAAGVLLAVPAVVLAVGGAVVGAAVVLVLVVAGVVAGWRTGPASISVEPTPAGSGRRDGTRRGTSAAGTPGRPTRGGPRADRWPTTPRTARRIRPARRPGTVGRVRMLAGTLLTLAAVAPIAARWPDLAVPGAGSVPVAELITSPAGATLVTGVAGPTFALVLAVQIWFWRGAGPGSVSLDPILPSPGPVPPVATSSGSTSPGPATSDPTPRGPGPSGAGSSADVGPVSPGVASLRAAPPTAVTPGPASGGAVPYRTDR